ncbi:hypothetical protein CW745_13105 [Psychromonas sp. psych-6C06]|uniref:hypothetical protein n=1 Tax=Psychromonas sp. psych-6C06 TaxID=2058089 RepID=UPI000C34E0D7|nr:hypothetical protein [Psychromonas sp. psych-6C06]PKF60806.1 hypothetical protein CW745_13105 [Psychromonas sp. psych-6C06]
MKLSKTSIVSWVVVLWICKVFLFSLPYKFTLHPDTQHIFGTIGQWMKDYIGDSGGALFMNYGSYAVGGVELLTSLILLSPALFLAMKKLGLLANSPSSHALHALGFALAAVVMSGAVFFHLFTPLGVEVIHEGQGDGGSLFYAATSILILGTLMAVVNYMTFKREA